MTYFQRGQIWKSPAASAQQGSSGTGKIYPASYVLILDADGSAIASDSTMPNQKKYQALSYADGTPCPMMKGYTDEKLKLMKRPPKEVQSWAAEQLAKF